MGQGAEWLLLGLLALFGCYALLHARANLGCFAQWCCSLCCSALPALSFISLMGH